MDKIETDTTNSNNLAAATTEQELSKPETVENEEKEIVPVSVADSVDPQPSVESEVVSNQYVTESNIVSIINCLLFRVLIYLCFLFINLYIGKFV